MALALFDRVQETTTTTGTGSVTLGGAVPGFQSFAVVGNGNTCYYTIVDGTAWEVGVGTYSTSGPTLARTTVLSNSSGNTSPITLAAGTKSIFLTYPAEKSVNLDGSNNVSPLGTVSSGVWQGSTVGVAYGGTGVTASSGANSVMLRDANQNVDVNRLNQANSNTAAAGGTTALTAASTYSQTLTGTGAQTFTMPDATTLATGVAFVFNNNATGTLTLANYAATTIGTITPGGAVELVLLNNSTTGGTWDVHGFLPENVTWGTNALNLGSTVITNGTWNGGTIGTAYGGTGLTSYTSGGAVYANSSSTLTSGTLPLTAGGTAATTASGARTSLDVPSTSGSGATGTWGINISGNAATATNSSTTSQTNFSNLTIGGSQVLYAGNYNSYAPTLTGTGASGTWGINISGNAATATNSSTTSQTNFSNLTIGGSQVLYAGNYNSYAPTLTGTGATGTWAINISGNANNISAYTINQNLGTGNQVTFDSVITGNNGNGTNFRLGDDAWIGDVNLANTTRLQGIQSAASGYLIFGNGDNTALGRAGTGALTYGGNTVLTSANYNSYAPTLTGTGATGTWAINVTGTSASISGFNNPTTAATANTIAYRDAAGDLTVRELVLNVAVQDFTPSSLVAIYPTTNQAVKVTAGGARTFLDVPTRSGGNASGTWGINITGSAGSAGSVDYANLTNKTGGTGTYTTSGDYRAPIFYDSNDTTYYLDPNSTGTALKVAGNIDLYARSAAWAEGIRIRVPTRANWGGIRWTRDEANSNGNWALGFTGIDSTDDLTFWGNLSGSESMKARLDLSANFTVYGSVRSPIFYDSDDTAYYINPNSSSFLNSVGVASSGLRMYRQYQGNSIWWNAESTNDTNHVLWNAYYGNNPITKGAAGSGFDGMLWNAYAGIQIRGGSAGAYNLITATPASGGGDLNNHAVGLYAYNALQLATANGYAYAPNSMRAPIFYDLDNTGYYLDPSAGGTVQGNWEFSSTNNSSTSYSVAGVQIRESNRGGGGYLSPRLGLHWGGVVASQIGIESGGRISILNNPGTGYEALVASISYGSESVRAPIFYDTENTGYYVNPNGSSNMSSINTDAFSTFNGGLSMGAAGGQRFWVYRAGPTRQGFGTDMTGNSYESDWFGSAGGSNQGRLSLGFVSESDGTTYTERARVQASGGILSAIYYDIDNTGYYLNPNGVSVLGGVNSLPLQVSKTSGVNSACTTFQNTSGDNSWGIVSEFRVGGAPGSDRPSILFSNGFDTNTWTIGFGYADSSYFRINRDHGYRNGDWGTTLMAMDRSGNVTFTGNVTAYSDERIKTNIKKIDNALGIVRKLEGVTFDYLADGRAGLGVIAQRVEEVLPMLVSESTSSNGQTYKNVAYGNMVGVLIEAAKEQDQEVVDLRARVDKLEALISKLTLG